jgi:uncharacterized damage-inducible protein DinB
MSTLAAELFRHHAWATDRLIEFCAGLSEDRLAADAPTAYGSITETLDHLVSSEAYYVFALSGRWTDPPLEDGARVSLDDLRSRARRTGEELIDLAERTKPDTVVRLMRSGEERSLPVAAVLAQALHHGAAHREQVVATLSGTGIKPPDLSGWAFGGDASSDYA